MQIIRYEDIKIQWPQDGRHILAQYDDQSIVVYQAYNAAIAGYAVEHQRFGGEFSYTRMSWIKPNFLWMMYRSGWATKPGQEYILAIRLRRSFFEALIHNAVPSNHDPSRYADHAVWQEAVKSSDVRLQWDPDHDPTGRPLERRAIQLGLRGKVLQRYGQEEIISIEDITEFVIEQRQCLPEQIEGLWVPHEAVYQSEL